MFAITKLSQASQSFISGLVQSNKTRSIFVSLCVARAITRTVSLPAEPVEDILAYYRNQAQLQVEVTINQLNEIMVLDTQTVVDFCLKMYQMRYYAAHPDAQVFSCTPTSAVCAFFGISRVFSEELLKALSENSSELAYTYNNLNKVLSELKG